MIFVLIQTQKQISHTAMESQALVTNHRCREGQNAAKTY